MITLACIICTTPEAFKILDAQTKINQVVPTHCFANGLARRGVPDKDINRVQSMDGRYPIRFYYQNNSTVGYMWPGYKDIYLNRKFHGSFSLCKTASNVAHEVTHTLGYLHKVDVPYAVNEAFEECCE